MTQEAERVYPVQGMAVDLGAGSLTVRGQGFTDESVRAAVERAGYRAPPR